VSFDFETDFRRESARLVAGLTRAFGAANLTLAEDVVQETFLRAMRDWPIRGIPPNPSAWLSRVARNLAIDRLRREGLYAGEEGLELVPAGPASESLLDDELAMLLMCAHPALSPESQIALTLKSVCGLGAGEIARGLLAREDAVAQRLVRAKATLRDSKAEFELPSGEELDRRLAMALRVLYLLFNEGYLAHQGDALTQDDICDEAILLTGRLAATKVGDRPEVHALLSLMLLHSSRLPARVSASGELCLLEDQDRSLWDRARVYAGIERLARSASGLVVTPYHCEAAIAACHASAPTFASTDWTAVLSNYDDLVKLAPSGIARLNRVVAFAMVYGDEAGLAELAKLEEPKLATYYLLPATRGRLLQNLGRLQEACQAYEQALGLATNEIERRFLLSRIGGQGDR